MGGGFLHARLIQPHLGSPLGERLPARQAGHIHKYRARVAGCRQGVSHAFLVGGFQIREIGKLGPVAQGQTTVAAQAIGVDEDDARFRLALAQVQGEAKRRGGLAETERPHQQMHALAPVRRTPGLDRHHAAKTFQHRSAGRGQQTLVQIHGHGVGNALPLQILQSHALPGSKAFHLNGGLHQSEKLILDLHPLLMPFAPAAGHARCVFLRSLPLKSGRDFMLDHAVLAVGAVAQNDGLWPHFNFDLGKNLLRCGAGECFYLHGPFLCLATRGPPVVACARRRACRLSDGAGVYAKWRPRQKCFFRAGLAPTLFLNSTRAARF